MSPVKDAPNVSLSRHPPSPGDGVASKVGGWVVDPPGNWLASPAVMVGGSSRIDMIRVAQ